MDNTKKNFIWNMVGATVNAFTSLAFLVIVTRINGTDTAGIFTFGFSLALLFQVISNYSGRAYQVTNIDESIRDSDFVYHRITSCLLALVAAAIYLAIKQYSLLKNTVILLFVAYRLLESMAEVMYGVVQKNNELYKVGKSLFWKGILGTAVFVAADAITENVVLAIIALVLINLVITLLYDYRNFRRFYTRNPYVGSINLTLFRLGIFVFGFTFLSQYILNAPKYAIDEYLTNEMQMIYGIVSMPASFILLCSQFIIQPLLVQFAALIREQQYRRLFRLSLKTLLIIAAIGMFGLAAAYFLGIPVLELIYGVPLKDYLLPLLVIITGATFYGLSFAISNVLTAMRKTFIQIIFYILCSGWIMFFSRYMVLRYSILGGTLSYAASTLLLCTLYLIYYLYILQKQIRYEQKETEN